MTSKESALDRFLGGDLGGALRQVRRNVKQMALDLTDLEVMVEEATSNETWGPHGTLLAKICRETSRSQESYTQTMGVLVGRIEDAWRKRNHWRHAYKSLLVIEYLVKNANESVVGELTDDEVLDMLVRLQKFKFVDDDMKDHGLNVRNRAKEVRDLIRDPERMVKERERAAASKAKLGGYGRNDIRRKAGSFGSSGSDLYESDNVGGWGKSKFRSGATLVRSKESYTKPVPVVARKAESPPPTSAAPPAPPSQEAKLTDLLNFEEEATGPTTAAAHGDEGGEGAAFEVPTPVKIKDEADGGAHNASKGKGKAKLLSQTKVNPKFSINPKGFGDANAQGAPSQHARGGAMDAGGLLGLEQLDLGGAAQPQPPPPQPATESWADFGQSSAAPQTASGESWADFSTPHAAVAPAAPAASPLFPPLSGGPPNQAMPDLFQAGAPPMGMAAMASPSLSTAAMQGATKQNKKAADPFADLLS